MSLRGLIFVVLRQVEALAAPHDRSCGHTYRHREGSGSEWPVCFVANQPNALYGLLVPFIHIINQLAVWALPFGFE